MGFGFFKKDGKVKMRVHPKSIKRLKDKIRTITGRSNGKSMSERLIEIRKLLTGWYNYFKVAELKSLAENIDGWIRRRLRMCFWKQWKNPKTKYLNLTKLGVAEGEAWKNANSSKGYWRMSNTPIIKRALTNHKLRKLGFIGITDLLGMY